MTELEICKVSLFFGHPKPILTYTHYRSFEFSTKGISYLPLGRL